MKYDIPSILDLKHGYLTDEEKEFFRAELDFTSMNDDIMEFWQSQFDRDIVLAEQAAEREKLAEEEEIEKIRNKEQKKSR